MYARVTSLFSTCHVTGCRCGMLPMTAPMEDLAAGHSWPALAACWHDWSARHLLLALRRQWRCCRTGAASQTPYHKRVCLGTLPHAWSRLAAAALLSPGPAKAALSGPCSASQASHVHQCTMTAMINLKCTQAGPVVHAGMAGSWLTGTRLWRWAAPLIWRQSVLQATTLRLFGRRLDDSQTLEQQGRVQGEYSMQQHPFARGGFGEVWRATKPGRGPAHCCPCS